MELPDADATTAGDASEEEWALVPTRLTSAGCLFYQQHLRDLQLIAAESTLVEEMERLALVVARAVLPDRPPAEAFPSLFRSVQQAKAQLRRNSAVSGEVLLTRYVDNFLSYVSEVTSLLFRHRPQALRSGEQVSLEDVLRHESLEKFVEWAADERVNRLSYKGLGAIAEYFESRFGLPLIDDREVRRALVRGVAIRNLLVHRRGIVDSRFLEVIVGEGFPSDDYEVGERISNLGHSEILPAVTGAVRSLESRLVAKFELPTVRATPHEWWVGTSSVPAEEPAGPAGADA